MRLLAVTTLAAALGALFPVGQLAADRSSERAHHRQVALELRRVQDENGRLRAAIARGVPWAPTPVLALIAACESGANPRALSPGGRYRGAWQFDRATWASVGGRGDPAAAPMVEQAWRAWLLFRARGAEPWPACGRDL